MLLFLLPLELLYGFFAVCRPVIKIMGDVMAFAAFLELFHNACCMRRTMAVLAFGYSLVLFLMAECACQGMCLALLAAKEVEGLFVACAAVL